MRFDCVVQTREDFEGMRLGVTVSDINELLDIDPEAKEIFEKNHAKLQEVNLNKKSGYRLGLPYERRWQSLIGKTPIRFHWLDTSKWYRLLHTLRCKEIQLILQVSGTGITRSAPEPVRFCVIQTWVRIALAIDSTLGWSASGSSKLNLGIF